MRNGQLRIRNVNNSLKKTQSILEFCLAFSVMAVFLCFGLRIWSELIWSRDPDNPDRGRGFILEARNYQNQRLCGWRRIPSDGDDDIGFDPDTGGGPDLPHHLLEKILKIKTCVYIDQDLKTKLIDLYKHQFKLEQKIKTQEEIISGLEETGKALVKARNSIPWCNCCRICRAVGITWCCFLSGGGEIDPNHSHNQQRADLLAKMIEIQGEINKETRKLHEYRKEKEKVDKEIQELEKKAAICFFIKEGF